MQAKKVSDVKNNLSRYLEQVRHGEKIRILLHGRPVADLVPVSDTLVQQDDVPTELLALERRGVLRRGSGVIPPQLFEVAPVASGRPVSQYVREEREESR